MYHHNVIVAEENFLRTFQGEGVVSAVPDELFRQDHHTFVIAVIEGSSKIGNIVAAGFLFPSNAFPVAGMGGDNSPPHCGNIIGRRPVRSAQGIGVL